MCKFQTGKFDQLNFGFTLVKDTGAPWRTGERGHGVGWVVFIHKATLIMIGSVLFAKILVL